MSPPPPHLRSCRNLRESDLKLTRWTDLDTVLLFPDPVEFILLPPSLKRLLFWSAARPKLHTYINKHAEKLPPDSARGENLKQLKVFTECGEFQKKSTHQDSVLLLLDWRWLAAKERKILKVIVVVALIRSEVYSTYEYNTCFFNID